jgi:hypothetical protein
MTRLEAAEAAMPAMGARQNLMRGGGGVYVFGMGEGRGFEGFK